MVKVSKKLGYFAFSTLFSALALSAVAAEVPAGTQLDQHQHLRWNIAANPASLDPQKIEGTPEGMAVRQLFEPLVISDAKGNVIPGAASKWDHSPDYKVWTFTLRPNGKWSNGDPVTAEDFVFAFQRLANPETASPYSSYLDYLKLKNADAVISGKLPPSQLGIKALNDHTLQLTLTEAVPYADKLLEHYVLSPVNKKVVEKYGDKWTEIKHIVGNGAFKPIKWVINEKMELVPNPYYWDNAKTVLKEVTLYPIVSSNTDVARYRSGDLDITGPSIPVELFKKMKKEYPNEVYVPTSLCSYFYEMNTQKPPFNNPKVRKALSMALDRNIITDKVLAQGQLPAYNFTPTYIGSGEKIQKPEWANWTQKQRNQKAIELLKEAGFDKQHPLDFSILYNTSESHKKIAIAASSILRKNLNGAVKVKLENQEWKTYLDTRHQGNYQVARAGWCADYNEATTFLNYFLSNSSNNTSFYKNEAYDNFLKEAFNAKDEEGRAQAYANAEAQLAKDMPYIPFYYYVSPRMVKPYVKGFAINHPGQNYYLKDVYLIKH